MGEAGEEAQYVIRPPDNHKFRAGAVKVRGAGAPEMEGIQELWQL